MIELIARGPVREYAKKRIEYEDGHDPVYGRATTIQEREVEIDVEFEQGHVNLEGFAPSQMGLPIDHVIGRFIDDSGDVELPGREWSVELQGEWFDWIQQAHRYVTERPGMSVLDALKMFRSWDETATDTISHAITEAKKSGLAAYEMGDLRDDECSDLRLELNNFEKVTIPESYSE